VTETQTVDLAAWLTAIWDEEEQLAEAIQFANVGGWLSPASVLARIAADRKILELHAALPGPYWPFCEACGGHWPCLTVRLLASPYKGREGWQEAWE
jgi:hypothetical protein